MRVGSLLCVPVMVLGLALPAIGAGDLAAEEATAAVETPEEAAPPEAGEETGRAGDPAPAALEDEPQPEAGGDARPEPEAASAAVTLGPIGYDAVGRPGRVHVVVPGDTLWDVSEAYLGTPWVWPSVWKDNDDIRNPHLIRPGDRIWITPSEMRRVSEAEAAELLAGQPRQDVPASLEDVSGIEATRPPLVYPYTGAESMGLVTQDAVDGAASLVDSPLERIWLAESDTVFLGLGEGEVDAGDHFTIFRTAERVLHPETGELFGYHVDVLGWAEVTEVEPETAVAMIRQSFAEMRRGDRVLPRELPTAEIELRKARESVDGLIVFTPQLRTRMASTDIVYLDRGSLDGLEVGNPLEVYRPGLDTLDGARDTRVRTPDWVVAKLLVVSAQEDSAVALVTHSTSELERGDLFRTTTDLALR